MRRIPVNDPTRHSAREKPGASQTLEGFVELGMRREALRLARTCLKRKSVRAEEFTAALNAILIQADRVEPWRSLGESVYERMNLRGQQMVRAKLLNFYVSLKDWIAAARFIPGRFGDVCEMLFVMSTLLNLKKMDEAKSLHRKCRRALAKTDEPAEQSALLEALATYHAQTGHLGVAEEYWKRSSTLEPFANNALTGLVQLQAVRGQLYLAAGRMQIEAFRKQWDPKLEIVPANELWRFGV